MKSYAKNKAEKPQENFVDRLNDLTERLDDVRTNFNSVTDEHAIDALIFEENAVLCHIQSLLEEARRCGITVQPHER